MGTEAAQHAVWTAAHTCKLHLFSKGRPKSLTHWSIQFVGDQTPQGSLKVYGILHI